jgi:type I restriction enzyme M protein
LGDAFEYLLSVLGSQGEAGQFRTPRHIIDFMVAIIDPKKDEVIMDPACGTAGFLISSYKHILKNNSSNYDPKTDTRTFETKNQSLSELIINSKNYKGDKLTPDERSRLAKNIKGYDISPDMVRLSLVNMYLHGLHAPQISEYDTLTSEDNWNEYGDVILANPPFMSPKGGIRPHKRFSVSSNRSEVLFVDYIAEHLTPNGRAAVIVPEGIIFQSGNAYKNLRKMLVENYLVGVISLPAGVFQPYSGVKTSILWLDRTLAKKTDKILFVKIENDGFDLGAQRRAIKQNDLPSVFEKISHYKTELQKGELLDLIIDFSLISVKRERVSASGDFNLSSERYRIANILPTNYPIVTLGEVIHGKPEYGSGAKKVDFDGVVRYLRITDSKDDGTLKKDDIVSPSITEPQYFLQKEDFLIARSGSVGRTYLHKDVSISCQFAGYLIRFKLNREKISPSYLFFLTKSQYYFDWIESMKKSGTISNINAQEYSSFSFPLPPISIQEEIVAEVESYQKIIDGARQVVENYRPRIDIDPEWPMVELGSLYHNLDGKRVPITKSDRKSGLYPYYGASGIVDNVDSYLFDEDLLLISEDGANLLARVTPIAFSVSGKVWVNNHAHVLRFDNIWTQKYIELYINSISIEQYITGSAQPKLNQKALNFIQIPLPGLEVQEDIVKNIEREKTIIDSNRDLIGIFEQKIKDRIAKVWGE